MTKIPITVSDHIFQCPKCSRESMLHLTDELDLERDFLNNGRIFRCPYHDCSARLTLRNRIRVQTCTTKKIEVTDIPTGDGHPFAYRGTPWVYIINAATDVNEQLLDACLTVRAFLDRLEEGTHPDDPLLALRRRFHAPMREKLEPAIANARKVTG